MVTGGVRYASRELDQTFGRYLINGSNPYGIGGVGAGTAAGNCCIGPGSGPWIYYSDPGYATIPYSTAVSNPNLAMTVHNFGVGNMIVKNPWTGGMTNPAHLPANRFGRAPGSPTTPSSSSPTA